MVDFYDDGKEKNTISFHLLCSLVNSSCKITSGIAFRGIAGAQQDCLGGQEVGTGPSFRLGVATRRRVSIGSQKKAQLQGQPISQ